MFTSLLLQASGAAGSATGGMADFVTDLSNTIGIDLFDEDIDNVVFQTNEFLCNSDFIGSQGPFWWLLVDSPDVNGSCRIVRNHHVCKYGLQDDGQA